MKEEGFAAGLRLAGSLGFLIAVPAVIFGFSGAFVDRELGTSPLFLILGFALAFTISAVAVVREVREVIEAEKK